MKKPRCHGAPFGSTLDVPSATFTNRNSDMADCDINVFARSVARAVSGGESVTLPKMSGAEFGRLLSAIHRMVRRS